MPGDYEVLLAAALGLTVDVLAARADLERRVVPERTEQRSVAYRTKEPSGRRTNKTLLLMSC